MEQFLIVCAMAPFHDAILPRTTRFAFAMNQVQLSSCALECTHPFWMKTILHREFEGVVGPDEKNGGSRSSARLRTPATVSDFLSGCISVYLSRVRR